MKFLFNGKHIAQPINSNNGISFSRMPEQKGKAHIVKLMATVEPSKSCVVSREIKFSWKREISHSKHKIPLSDFAELTPNDIQ